MSADFTNIYQEILLDNLVAIIKQNFAFQTQIKLSENVGQRNVELEKQVQQLQIDLQQLEVYKNKAEQNNSAHEEKSRIQVALNDELQKSSSYKQEIDKKNVEIIKLSGEIKVLMNELEILKELVPASKLKKVPKPVETVIKEEPKIQKFIEPINIKLSKFESGGTF